MRLQASIALQDDLPGVGKCRLYSRIWTGERPSDLVPHPLTDRLVCDIGCPLEPNERSPQPFLHGHCMRRNEKSSDFMESILSHLSLLAWKTELYTARILFSIQQQYCCIGRQIRRHSKGQNMNQNTASTPESLRLVGAALALQQASGTAAQLVPLPGTDRFVLIGTADEVAQLLPAPDTLRVEARAILCALATTGWSDTLPTDPDARAMESAIRKLVVAPAAPVGQTGIPRYKLVPGQWGEWMAPAADGAWCRWDHVAQVAQATPASAGEEECRKTCNICWKDGGDDPLPCAREKMRRAPSPADADLADSEGGHHD